MSADLPVYLRPRINCPPPAPQLRRGEAGGRVRCLVCVCVCVCVCVVWGAGRGAFVRSNSAGEEPFNGPITARDAASMRGCERVALARRGDAPPARA